MNHVDAQYNAIVANIRESGVDKADRTGVGSRSVFGERAVYDLTGGSIPLLTSKKVFTKGSIHELLWFISGDDNIEYLLANDVHIWDSWIDKTTAEYDSQGNLIAARVPNVYGVQWRQWEDTKVVPQAQMAALTRGNYEYWLAGYIDGDFNKAVVTRKIDQLQQVIDTLRNNPDSRRIIMTAWNVGMIDQMGLPPCHCFIQFWTRELLLEERIDILSNTNYDFGKTTLSDITTAYFGDITHEKLDEAKVPRRSLSGQLYLRSQDIPLGAPFNIAQYGVFMHLIAQCVGMVAETLIHIMGDTHVYQNQWEALDKQMAREPFADNTARVVLNPDITDIDEFTFDDIEVVDYESHKSIKFPQAAV